HTSELWQEILSIIQTKLSKPSFDTWFKATKALTITDHSVVISAPTTFAVEWLESRYTKLVSATVLEVVGKQVDVRFVIEEAKGHEPVPQQISPPLEISGEEIQSHMLNPKYTFDTFVIGSGNRFAHAASLAVAEAPAK
ncbi:chromosomal replication initiator protein DnaA, partial [Streptomyces sp. WAC04770]